MSTIISRSKSSRSQRQANLSHNQECANCQGCAVSIRANKGSVDSIDYCKDCGRVLTPDPSNSDVTTVLSKNRALQNTSSQKQDNNTTPVSIGWNGKLGVSDQSGHNFALALGYIDQLILKLGIDRNMALKASVLCKNCFAKSLSKGSSLRVLAATIVYFTASEQNIPINVQEIADTSGTSKSKIIRCHRKLQRRLKLSISIPAPRSFVDRIIGEIPLATYSTHQRANRIIEKADRKGISQGKNPATVAGAALYLAARQEGLFVTQRDIAKVTHVTETSIRNRISDLLDT